MADKHILKITKRQAAVKVSGTGSATISIYDLAHPGPNAITDTQVVTPANVQLMVTDIAYSTTAAGNITRNSNVIWVMNQSSEGEYNFTEKMGVNLNESANANVVVNLGGTEGVCIIQFSKGAGYNDRDLQNQGPGVDPY
jgi:hypothetical protein